MACISSGTLPRRRRSGYDPSAIRARVSVEVALDAFYLEHRRCGELDTGVEDGRVWMRWDSCGASIGASIT